LKIQITNRTYTPLSDGFHKVRFLKIEESSGRWGLVFKSWFQVVEGKFKGCELCDLMNQSSNGINSKISRMIFALSSQRPKPGEVETDSLIGQLCYIKVEKKGKNNAITEYIPLSDFKDIG